MIKFVDLFAGIGGLRLGFEQACAEGGISTKCVLSSEIDPRACETYKLNFCEEPLGDIRNISQFPKFDFLLAGFPCQPFSYAGKKMGFGDTRGTLFFEIERILKTCKPKAFLLENVRGLTTHDNGRTFKTIINKLEKLGYGTKHLLLNSHNFGVPQNRVRVYIFGILESHPTLLTQSDKGAPDSHAFKNLVAQMTFFNEASKKVLVKDILEDQVPGKYMCSKGFIDQLSQTVGSDFSRLHGARLIDYRGGKSIHSWELGLRGKCTNEEIEFTNKFILYRRKKIFGAHQDGKKLTYEQIKSFYGGKNLKKILNSLTKKGYLKYEGGKYNPVCGNMSFEVFKFLDPESISVTLVSSDAHKLGVVQHNIPRHVTPRECARMQGFPDSFICHPVDTYAYKQFGNAVTVKTVKAIVKDFLENNNLGTSAKQPVAEKEIIVG